MIDRPPSILEPEQFSPWTHTQVMPVPRARRWARAVDRHLATALGTMFAVLSIAIGAVMLIGQGPPDPIEGPPLASNIVGSPSSGPALIQGGDGDRSNGTLPPPPTLQRPATPETGRPAAPLASTTSTLPTTTVPTTTSEPPTTTTVVTSTTTSAATTTTQPATTTTTTEPPPTTTTSTTTNPSSSTTVPPTTTPPTSRPPSTTTTLPPPDPDD